MWELIQTWTFFNWLALIAFFLSCISVINAFLSLKTRFKDWFAIRSKEALRKRLIELENIAQNTRRNINEPSTLLIDVLWQSTTFLLVQSFLLIMIIIVVYVLHINKVSIESIYLIIFTTFINFLSEFIRFIQSVRQKIIYTKDLSSVTKEAEELIGGAKRLGLISDSEIITIQNMIESKSVGNTN